MDEISNVTADIVAAVGRRARSCFGTLLYGRHECGACGFKEACRSAVRPHDAVVLEAALGAISYAMTVPVPTGLNWMEALPPKTAPSPAATAPTRPDPAHLFGLKTRPSKSTFRGAMKPDAVNTISSASVAASHNHQARAKDVPWPVNFYMEVGNDRRHVQPLEDRAKRHQIDWFRGGSCVEPMPNIEQLRRVGNPYHGAVGVGAAIACETWIRFIAGGGNAAPEDIAVDVLARAGVVDKPYNRNCVRDTLRDCALFGLVTRWRVGNRIVFIRDKAPVM